MKANELAVIVETIIRSPLISRYNVGITLNSQARRRGYLGVGFDHYVVLDFGLSCARALARERELFELLTGNTKGVSYRKYRETVRDASYRASTGGIGMQHDRKYDIYLAWWNKGSDGYQG